MKFRFLLLPFALVTFSLSLNSCINKEQTKYDLVSVIPDNSIAIFHLKNVENALKKIENSDLTNEIINTKISANLASDLSILKNINQLYSTNDHLSEIVISSQLIGRDDTDFIYVVKNYNIIEKFNIQSFGKSIFNDTISISQKYNDADIFSFNNGSYFASNINDMIVLSHKEDLLKLLIRELNTTKNSDKKNTLLELRKSSNSIKTISAFIHIPTFKKFIPKHNNSQLINFMANTSGWIELDIDLRKEQITCNGFSLISDSENKTLHKLLKNDEIELNYENIIPQETSNVIAINIQKGANLLNQSADSLNRIFIESLFIDEVENKMLFFEINENNQIHSKFIAFNIKSESLTKNLFDDFAKSYSTSKSIKIDSVINKRTIGDNNFTIYCFNNVISSQLDNTVDASFACFWFIYDGYIIGTNSLLSADLFLMKKQRGSSFANLNISKQLNKQSSNKCNISIDIRELSKLGLNVNASFRWQIMTQDNSAYNNIVLIKNSDKKKTKTEKFFTKVDTACSMISRVTNHSKPNENEFFIQDYNNKIYLISSSGKILWNKVIDGQILGKINQVDFYKNRKLQYIFNTKNTIYLIDINGDSVENYPITLENKATNGLSVIDYDSNRKYRYFIATDNKKIKCFDISGKELEGWDFRKSETIVTGNIQHIVHDSKDYIIFSDANKVYILNRKGETRIKVSKPLKKPIKSDFVITSSENNFFFNATDSDNHLVVISEKGKIAYPNNDEQINISNTSANGKLLTLKIDDNKIKISSAGDKYFYNSITGEIANLPFWFKEAGLENVIGYCDVQNQTLNAVNLTGEAVLKVRYNSPNAYLLYKNTATNNLNILISDNQGVILNCN